jgi:hypothetical protein
MVNVAENMNNLSDILKKFQPISLEEMDSVKLMDRFDTKFFCHSTRFAEILLKLLNDYRILEIKSNRQFLYTTTYFDTPELLLYCEHQNGKQNRIKIRQRRYDVTGTEYFEVKHKDNKGRTSKSRIKNNSQEYLNENTDLFLKNCTPYSNTHIHSVIKNEFFRITLVNNFMTERATMDHSILFDNHQGEMSFPALGIIEVKQDKCTGKSIMLDTLKEMKIRPDSISKYCLGIASLQNGVKINTFKSKILKINNL